MAEAPRRRCEVCGKPLNKQNRVGVCSTGVACQPIYFRRVRGLPTPKKQFPNLMTPSDPAAAVLHRLADGEELVPLHRDSRRDVPIERGEAVWLDRGDRVDSRIINRLIDAWLIELDHDLHDGSCHFVLTDAGDESAWQIINGKAVAA